MGVAKPKVVPDPITPATSDGEVADPTHQQTPEPPAPVADDDAGASRVRAVTMKDLGELEAAMAEKLARLEARAAPVADPPPFEDPADPSPLDDPDEEDDDLPILDPPPAQSRWPWLVVAALAVVAGVLFYLRRRASP